MFKSIALLFSVTLPLSISQSFATFESIEEFETETKKGTALKAIWKKPKTDEKFILESAGPDSFKAYKDTLANLPIKDGYPVSEKGFKLQGTDRQEAQNPYHLYKLSSQIKEGDKIRPLGFFKLGYMPTRGYEEGTKELPTAHHPIITKWMNLGITKQKDPKGGLENANLERVGNRGLAVILPLFNVTVSPEEKTGAIEACYEFVCELTNRSKLLPLEKTLPHVVVSLLSPTDPNIEAFKANGFTADSNEGFGWFYPKDGKPQPRTLLTRPVEIK